MAVIIHSPIQNNLKSNWQQVHLFENGYYDFNFTIKSKDFVQLDLLNQICKTIHHNTKLQLKGWDNKNDYMSINAGLTLNEPGINEEVFVMISKYIKIIFNAEISDYRFRMI